MLLRSSITWNIEMKLCFDIIDELTVYIVWHSKLLKHLHLNLLWFYIYYKFTLTWFDLLVGLIKDIYSNVKGALEGITKPTSGKQENDNDVYSNAGGSNQYQPSLSNYGRLDFLPLSSSSTQNPQSSGLWEFRFQIAFFFIAHIF